MLYKLLLNNIDGTIYTSVKSIYSETVAAVRVNQKMTDWFYRHSGVKKGDNCSPTLFSTFVNDFVREINDLGLGITVNDAKVSVLSYADDICLLAYNEQDLQSLLDTLRNWCKRWRVLINTKKSKVVHFRTGRRRRSDFQFKVGDNVLETTDRYKYLGVIFTDKRNFNDSADNLAKAGGRALGAVISKLHNVKEYGIKTYEKLINSCVVPILDYNSSVWGYKEYDSIDMVQNRSLRYFLGTASICIQTSNQRRRGMATGERETMV